MSSLKAYDNSLDYAYAPGLFPTLECLNKKPEWVRRVLIHSKAENTDALERIMDICRQKGIRTEPADKALARISAKENCFAAAVFEKRPGELCAAGPHIVLHHPGDQGNLGTILRTSLGFGIKSIALIRPCADVYDPKVIRASMGALFSLNVRVYDGFSSYRDEFPAHHLYPFMLDGAVSLNDVGVKKPYALVFGNEGKGLPAEFAKLGQPVRIPHSDEIDSLNLAVAAAIGAYFFVNKEGL